ncbi:MAG: nuclear transport factor 2 family protein, partial [Candidatus Krumholzibacteria bacterium]|nr:nuclear transport factor 2 family protein [Candidatus Krumholzibacteria bacterium]
MTGRGTMAETLERWLRAWDERDLDGVMALFAGDAVFESWSGARVAGRDRIRAAWEGWFAA